MVEITIVSINNLKSKQITYVFPQNIKKDNPDFDISSFNNGNIVTENVEFKISAFENEITLLFSMEDGVSTSVEMEHVIFLLDEQSQLIGLKFFGFSKEQWEILCNSLKIY